MSAWLPGKLMAPIVRVLVRGVKELLVQRAQTVRIERIEALAKAHVAWRPLDPVERLEVRPRCRLPAVLRELQQQYFRPNSASPDIT
jgi:hypothetical protein